MRKAFVSLRALCWSAVKLVKKVLAGHLVVDPMPLGISVVGIVAILILWYYGTKEEKLNVGLQLSLKLAFYVCVVNATTDYVLLVTNSEEIA